MELSNSRRNIVAASISAVLIFLLVAGYFYFFPSMNKQIVQAEEQLVLEEKLLAAVQSQQVEHVETISPTELRALQRQVPVKPLVDQFIFDLEKAEIYSDSFIVNYGFGEGSFSGSGITVEDENDANGSKTEDGDEGTTPIVTSSERVTVNMTVETPGYDELIEFLNRIEQLERITKIDQLTFTGNREVIDLDQTVDDIRFAITISTFYLPELEEFADYLPKMNYPSHSKRYNPLYYGVKEDKKDEQE